MRASRGTLKGDLAAGLVARLLVYAGPVETGLSIEDDDTEVGSEVVRGVRFTRAVLVVDLLSLAPACPADVSAGSAGGPEEKGDLKVICTEQLKFLALSAHLTMTFALRFFKSMILM